MTQVAAILPISRPTLTPVRLSFLGRLAAAGIGLGCLAVLIVALRVEPNRSGFGTHTQIGMRPCGFLEATGLPCGTCGMTTSFSHFVRGNLAASFYLQPLGCILAIVTSATVWVAGHAAVTARPGYRVLRRMPAGWTIAISLTIFLLAWAWKMLLVIRGVDGW